MPVEFLDSDPQPETTSPPDRHGRQAWRPRIISLLLGVALAVLAVAVIAGRSRDERPSLSPDLPYRQVHQAADEYERHVQCLGQYSRALAAMPRAYRRAEAVRAGTGASERTARAALARAVNSGPGSPSYDILVRVWTAHRAQLLGHAATQVSALADRTCRAVGS